ncbi:MAG: aromatic ring-hydroxylating oxygenase subunit alpha, partial [Stellaceae bacterium]
DREHGQFLVSRRVFTDPAVLKAEQERIFAKCWLYLGHDSEIALPGAYLTRYVAGRDLIFNRDARGVVHAFYNLCLHRGGRVCRDKAGSARMFACIYHGWVYDADGRLRHLPQEDLYPEGYAEKSHPGLVPVPKLEHYRGFWFICLDPDAMSLSDYLAGAKAYIDDIADQSELGMANVPGAQEFTVNANWKLWHENGMDPFHVATVHASYFDFARETNDTVKQRDADAASSDVVNMRIDAKEMMRRRYDELVKSKQAMQLDLGNGHMAYHYASTHGRPVAMWHPSWSEAARTDIDEVYRRLVARVGEERAKRIALQDHHVLIFPNLAIVDNHGIMVRTYYSQQPESMTVQSWTLAPREETPELRRVRLYSYMDFLGPAGFGTPDDIEAIEEAQRGYRASRDFGGWNDVSAGMAPKNPAGRAQHGDEGRIRVFWSTWDKYVSPLVLD